MAEKKLRVAVATPLPARLAQFITDAEPRIELIYHPDLLPPQRWHADFAGDPTYQRTPLQQEAFEGMLSQADALYGIPDVDPELLATAVRANPKLRWVQTMAAGGGASVKDAHLTDRELKRVTFTTSAGVHARPLAEFALFGLLAGAKNLPRLERDQRDHAWPHRWAMNQLSEQTIFILGLGSIGAHTASLLSSIGTTVIGTSRHAVSLPAVSEVVDPRDHGAMMQAMARADGVVVTLPGTDETRGMLSRSLLEAAKPGLVVCSVGRGIVIDEEALIDGLRSGQIGFAAVDVTAHEPLDHGSELWDLPNVLISPHTAANSPHEERLIAELFVDNAGRLLDGRQLRNVVNTREFY